MRVDSFLLCELAAYSDFPRLMADLKIYVNGVAVKQVQSGNAIVDTMSFTIIKQHDINRIALDLREAHRDDFLSVPAVSRVSRRPE